MSRAVSISYDESITDQRWREACWRSFPMLNEPPPSQADLHFRVLDIPVRVNPFFWVISLLLGLRFFDGEPVGTLLGVCVVFVSVLVHELGHAVMQIRFGGHPRIVLHGLGGLAICGDCDRSPKSQILISLAGPFAGFLLAGGVALLVVLASQRVAFVPFWQDAAKELDTTIPIWVVLGDFRFQPFGATAVFYVVVMALLVNIFWGILNLLPVYPLDGGQVARELFTSGTLSRARHYSLPSTFDGRRRGGRVVWDLPSRLVSRHHVWLFGLQQLSHLAGLHRAGAGDGVAMTQQPACRSHGLCCTRGE